MEAQWGWVGLGVSSPVLVRSCREGGPEGGGTPRLLPGFGVAFSLELLPQVEDAQQFFVH